LRHPPAMGMADEARFRVDGLNGQGIVAWSTSNLDIAMNVPPDVIGILRQLFFQQNRLTGQYEDALSFLNWLMRHCLSGVGLTVLCVLLAWRWERSFSTVPDLLGAPCGCLLLAFSAGPRRSICTPARPVCAECSHVPGVRKGQRGSLFRESSAGRLGNFGAGESTPLRGLNEAGASL
jgi:hypothetical protein